MENENTRKDAPQGTDLNNDWQLAENRDNTENDFADDADLKAAEADGYGTEETYEPFSAVERDDDDPEEDEDEDNDEDDDENGSSDWGTVDPIKERDGFPDPMDPSGPGSAV